MVGTLIKKIRELKGYSQEFLADQINISQSAYSDLENNKTKIDLVRLQKIANILDTNILELIANNSPLDSRRIKSISIYTLNLDLFDQLKDQYEKRLKEKDILIEQLKSQLRNL
ncbi:helix-turn-helix domain-containing protein [Psychroserpens algicola]|uniref:helix-turn-helix domain-containing protein n=1 Tax=Psychroserpens algicola TaxID=1719034 RepID=UPI0019538C97|nr:helix-turn-helix transcriptional regulator [Psychroserpens algicola]